MLCRSVIAVIVMIGIGSTTIPAGIAITLHLFNETHNASEVVSNINTSVGWSKLLTELLMKRHNKNAPPDGIVDVHYEMELVHILGIDELKQTMTALKWFDPMLTWNATEFGGISKTWLPFNEIWLPDIIIFNMVSGFRLNHEDLLSSVRAPAVIYANGTVECSHPAVYTVSCHINIKNFPLDDQRCSFNVSSWAYGTEKIKLHAHVEHSLDHYAPNEEWHLKNVSVDEDEYEHEGIKVSEIRFDVDVRRKPLFYMVTLTFPSYVMCSISIVGLYARFSTTGEREERFTLGVTAILTMAVLSLVVSEKVPHSSTSVPLLVAYFLFNMVIVSVAAMTTGFVMRVHRKGRHGDEPPSWLLFIFCIRKKSKKRSAQSIINHVDNCTSSANSDPLLPASASRQTNSIAENRKYPALEGFIKRLIDACEAMQVDLSDDDFGESTARRRPSSRLIHQMERNGWVRLAERLDWIFMITYLCAVTFPVLILCIWMKMND